MSPNSHGQTKTTQPLECKTAGLRCRLEAGLSQIGPTETIRNFDLSQMSRIEKKRTTRCNQFFLLRMRRVLLDAISLVQRMPQDAARRYKKGVRCKLNVIQQSRSCSYLTMAGEATHLPSLVGYGAILLPWFMVTEKLLLRPRMYHRIINVWCSIQHKAVRLH